ncbi:hypothetical protein [Fluoribacter dumoffii]|uniref:Uncharacterized protein n=1 Tax=Fluoribacter dumoffii TaxID=463 RepID=A0A377ITP8_9GAMM|nr:hypothetical protein [Fluoribacter dumoffii]KTC89159.1 hypothetical protein Ldum_2835 [Fluoribacter dumoffii NY 23]STO91569.1 Uncharacterised protein [Fluoribacter dumoffii]
MKSITKDLGVITLIGLLLLWSFIAGIERLVFFNGNKYPDFMVNKKISLDSREKLYKLTQLTCPDGNDIVEKNGAIYVRCGLLWPLTQVSKISLINTPAKN